MRDFPIIYLLLYTKTGRVILAILVGYTIISLIGWWLIPIITALFGALSLYLYKKWPRYNKDKKRIKTDLVVGICLIVFAILSSLFMLFQVYRELLFDYFEGYRDPMRTEEVVDTVDTSNWEPDTIIVPESKGAKTSVSVGSSSSSYSHKSSNYDNMRGFDPTSEDDMDDNGMSRYMENNDDEGWD